MKFLPIKEFEKRQKSIDESSRLALMSTRMKIKTDAIQKKKKALDRVITKEVNCEFFCLACEISCNNTDSRIERDG